MRFSWDSKKSDANFRERGFDFNFASLIFDGPTLEREDTRMKYGERRIIAIGLAVGLEFTVCYTDRADITGMFVRRIISARRSNRSERKAYREAVKNL